jgi:hypothetical protein
MLCRTAASVLVHPAACTALGAERLIREPARDFEPDRAA